MGAVPRPRIVPRTHVTRLHLIAPRGRRPRATSVSPSPPLPHPHNGTCQFLSAGFQPPFARANYHASCMKADAKSTGAQPNLAALAASKSSAVRYVLVPAHRTSLLDCRLTVNYSYN